MHNPPHFIINPAAARGRAGVRWAGGLRQELQVAFPGMTFSLTTPERSLADCAIDAVLNDHNFLVGVGGDGTHHDIINGLIRANLHGRVLYAPFPLGSGNDWVRTLGLSRNFDEWVAAVRAGNTIDHLVGWVGFHTPEGRPEVRYFINVAGMAYDAEVVRRSEKLPLKHRYLYPLLTVGFLGKFTAPKLRLRYGDRVVEDHFHTVNLGVCKYSGGGMRLVPQADPTGQLLALTYVRRLPVWKIILNGWRFYTPHIGRVSGVTVTKTESATIECLAGRLEVEADGEWLGYGPLEIGINEERVRVLSTFRSADEVID